MNHFFLAKNNLQSRNSDIYYLLFTNFGSRYYFDLFMVQTVYKDHSLYPDLIYLPLDIKHIKETPATFMFSPQACSFGFMMEKKKFSNFPKYLSDEHVQRPSWLLHRISLCLFYILLWIWCLCHRYYCVYMNLVYFIMTVDLVTLKVIVY